MNTLTSHFVPTGAYHAHGDEEDPKVEEEEDAMPELHPLEILACVLIMFLFGFFITRLFIVPAYYEVDDDALEFAHVRDAGSKVEPYASVDAYLNSMRREFMHRVYVGDLSRYGYVCIDPPFGKRFMLSAVKKFELHMFHSLSFELSPTLSSASELCFVPLSS